MGDQLERPRRPGWYPDPTGIPMQRYHNGSGWTVHRAPMPIQQRPAAESELTTPIPVTPPPTPASAPPDVVGSSRRGRKGRALDRVLTLVVLGSIAFLLIVSALLGLAFLG